MKCACSFTPVLALVGLVGLGVGGYNLMSTGCPLGSCDKTAATTNVVNASDTTMDCCAGMDKAECDSTMASCETKSASCEGDKAAAAVKTVANETKAEDCATECSAKTCEDKLAKGECPHAVKTTDGKQTCPMHPETGAVATKNPK